MISKRAALGWASIGLFVTAALCLISYKMIGVHVDEQGILLESFPLIPLGWLLFFGGIVTGGGWGILRIKDSK